jgi:hypothetical protein
MTKNSKQITAEKKNWDLKLSIKDVQVTKEAFSSQKRTSSALKHEISKFFFLLL